MPPATLGAVHSTDLLQVNGHRVTSRVANSADAAFLESVYASMRAVELGLMPWTDGQKRHFIAHQFSAQAKAYQENYPGAEFLVLIVDGADAGRLYLHRRADEIRVMDIGLLPAFRNHGIGTALLRRVLEEGERTMRRVTIHVEIFNPAQRLYGRLGFREIPQPNPNPVYRLMEWSPAPRPAG